MQSIDNEIDAIAAGLVSATELRRMAQTYLVRDEIEKARATLEKATGLCRGYAKFPDLSALLGPSGTS